jgi:hypothetical protein
VDRTGKHGETMVEPRKIAFEPRKEWLISWGLTILTTKNGV